MGKRLKVEFDDLEKFYTECDIQEDTGSPSQWKEISEKNEPSWVGLPLEEIKKSKYFYNKGLDKLGSLTEEILGGCSKTEFKYDEQDGDDMNYDRFIEGLPSMKKRVRKGGNKNGRFINLHVGICECCAVSHKDMLYKAYTAVKLADYLESQGYRVQITTFAEVASLGYFKNELLDYLLVEVTIKKFEDPLLLPTILTCVSPWMFRHHMFKFWTAKFRCGWGLGHVPSMTRQSNKEHIFISSGECLDEIDANRKIKEIQKISEDEHGDEE